MPKVNQGRSRSIRLFSGKARALATRRLSGGGPSQSPFLATASDVNRHAGSALVGGFGARLFKLPTHSPSLKQLENQEAPLQQLQAQLPDDRFVSKRSSRRKKAVAGGPQLLTKPTHAHTRRLVAELPCEYNRRVAGCGRVNRFAGCRMQTREEYDKLMSDAAGRSRQAGARQAGCGDGKGYMHPGGCGMGASYEMGAPYEEDEMTMQFGGSAKPTRGKPTNRSIGSFGRVGGRAGGCGQCHHDSTMAAWPKTGGCPRCGMSCPRCRPAHTDGHDLHHHSGGHQGCQGGSLHGGSHGSHGYQPYHGSSLHGGNGGSRGNGGRGDRPGGHDGHGGHEGHEGHWGHEGFGIPFGMGYGYGYDPYYPPPPPYGYPYYRGGGALPTNQNLSHNLAQAKQSNSPPTESLKQAQK